jgi:hypothetical protein
MVSKGMVVGWRKRISRLLREEKTEHEKQLKDLSWSSLSKEESWNH